MAPQALIRKASEAVFPGSESTATLFTLDMPAIDGALGGGLARGTLHEIFAAGTGDAAAAAGFALGLSARAANGRAILWIRQDIAGRETGQVHAPGLADLGLDPARIVLITAREPLTVLKAASEGLRCAGFGAVLIELWGLAPSLDLTATRRLFLTAAASGVTAFLLRAGAQPTASAAMTRWDVKAAASIPLPANAPGNPIFEINLIRHRTGIPGRTWHVEWSREECSFRDPAPLPGAVVPAFARRSSPPGDVETPWRRTG